MLDHLSSLPGFHSSIFYANFHSKMQKKYLRVHWQKMAQQARKIAQTCLRRSAFLQLCASCGWPLIYIELVFCWISMSFELLLQQLTRNLRSHKKITLALKIVNVNGIVSRCQFQQQLIALKMRPATTFIQVSISILVYSQKIPSNIQRQENL